MLLNNNYSYFFFWLSSTTNDEKGKKENKKKRSKSKLFAPICLSSRTSKEKKSTSPFLFITLSCCLIEHIYKKVFDVLFFFDVLLERKE